MSTLESAEEFHARVAEATDDDGRLPVAIELMPGWDIFPFELDGLRIKPLEPMTDAEPPRVGDDPATCPCRQPLPPEQAAQLVWSNERWTVPRGPLRRRWRAPAPVLLRPPGADAAAARLHPPRLGGEPAAGARGRTPRQRRARRAPARREARRRRSGVGALSAYPSAVQVTVRPATASDVGFLTDVVIEATLDQGRLPDDFVDFRSGFGGWT